MHFCIWTHKAPQPDLRSPPSPEEVAERSSRKRWGHSKRSVQMKMDDKRRDLKSLRRGILCISTSH